MMIGTVFRFAISRVIVDWASRPNPGSINHAVTCITSPSLPRLLLHSTLPTIFAGRPNVSFVAHNKNDHGLTIMSSPSATVIVSVLIDSLLNGSSTTSWVRSSGKNLKVFHSWRSRLAHAMFSRISSNDWLFPGFILIPLFTIMFLIVASERIMKERVG